jgi:hypothetical protein
VARNLARSGTQKATGAAEAKAKVLDLIQDGMKVEQAMAVVDRTPETYRSWMKDDAEFKDSVRTIRAARAGERVGAAEVPDFPTFCADYLGQPLSMHQLRMWDVIEGREPRDLHDSMTFERGYSNRVLQNVPPDHAKTTTFTINYCIWKIHKDPDIRIVLVSKGLKLAQDFLYEIKLKLTSSQFREMHLKFAPEGGWKDPDGSWTGDRIYVKGKNEKGVQKDPTVQAMGLKGQIYGRRADLVILDDIIDSDNAREVDTQLRKINRDISSRLPSDQEGGGLLLVLGTRVAPMDVYRVLTEQEDGDGRRVWTYFRQPAVLDYGNGDSSTWTTLWPERWAGPALSRRRVDSAWNLFFQQLDVDDDMTFKAEAVNASVNGLRFPGPMTVDGKGHRPGGMEGLYIAIGLDPAASGNTAIIVAGLDRESSKRWVIDGWNKPNATASDIIAKFKELTDKYRPHEWVIEQNAFQRFLTQLPEIREYAAARGVRISPSFTTAKNKFDSDWGISTMGPLFDSCVKFDDERKMWRPSGTGLIELPSTRQNPWVNELIQQLTIWQPDGMAQKQKTDLVMALWFTHLALTAQVNRKRSIPTHMTTPWMSPGAKRRQGVIDLVAIRRQRQLEQEATA